MRCIVLASGSSGNSIYLEAGHEAVLIDAGLSGKEILRRISLAGADPHLLKAIFLTHEHGDHITGAAPIARRLGIPIFGTEGTLKDIPEGKGKRQVDKRKITVYTQIIQNELKITPFKISHDAREPCGFCIEGNEGTVTICTDTGIVTERTFSYLKKSDLLLLESNYCPEMLKKNPYYPEHLKRRIRSEHGHLSNDDAARVLQSLSCDISAVILSHRSKDNNTPDKAMKSAQNALMLQKDEIRILLARRKEETDSDFVRYDF